MIAEEMTNNALPHLAVVACHPARTGGMERFGRFVVSQAINAGWRVTVALSGEDIYSDLRADPSMQLAVDQVNWLDRTFAGDRQYRCGVVLGRRRWFRRARPDVALFIQSSNTPMRASVLGAFLAGVPVVTTHRTMPWPIETLPPGKHLLGLLPGLGLHRRLLVGKTRLTALLARTVVFNSEQIRQDYERLYRCPRGRSCVIPNAVERPFELPTHVPPRPAVTIGYVGRLSREKRLDVLLHAFARLRNREHAKLVLYGDGPERGSLEQLASDLGIAEGIAWHGHAADVWPAYRTCDVVVLCSPRESSSNMVLEAMAAGKAVVVTNAGGLPELIRHDQAGLCVPAMDVPALANALDHLIANRELRTDLGRRGAEIACLYHNPRQIGMAWLDVFCRAAGVRYNLSPRRQRPIFLQTGAPSSRLTCGSPKA